MSSLDHKTNFEYLYFGKIPDNASEELKSQLSSIQNPSGKNIKYRYFTSDKIEEIINAINGTSVVDNSDSTTLSRYKQWKRRYCVKTFIIDDEERQMLYARDTSNQQPTDKRIVAADEVFEIINLEYTSSRKASRAMYDSHFKQRYFNIYLNVVVLFVKLCPLDQHMVRRKVKPKGARNPILSNYFRERFQVDLIDFRNDPQKDYNGILMKWLMVLKDHFSKLLYLRAIPTKEAEPVARELNHIFGFIGFPEIFHTDNGNEFIANTVLKIVKSWNPSCTTVTGRPRQPSDQGSVENINGHVKTPIYD